MEFGIPHLFGYLIALSHILGAVAALHAVLTVRTAQGAIAWALSLLFMPYLTLLPYLVFGSRSFDAYIRARRQANREMHQAIRGLDWSQWVSEALAARRTVHSGNLLALPRLGSMPPLAHNQVRLLIDGEATFAAIFAAIAAAERVVLVQFFIVRDDDLGRRLADLLLQRAAAGVEVYLLYDRIGSHELPAAYGERLRAGGVQVCAFATRRGLINRFQLNFRNHRKIVVVDGAVGFVGGHNVGNDYLGGRPPLSPWRDTHVELRGPALTCLQESFAEDWFWAARRLPPLLLPDDFGDGEMVCQVLATGPADAQETCSLFFVEAINAARERLWITTPYFIPDEAVFSALRLAVLRGVDVRILLPARADHRMVYAASTLYAFEALRAGIRVFRYRPGFLHQKVVLIDTASSAIGSANLDNRSFRLNFEIMLLTHDAGFSAQVEAMLDVDFAQAYELSQEDDQQIDRLRQLGMRVARLISPIL